MTSSGTAIVRRATGERCAAAIADLQVGTTWTTDGDSMTLAVCRHAEPGVIGEVTPTLASARARQMEIGWVFNPLHARQGSRPTRPGHWRLGVR